MLTLKKKNVLSALELLSMVQFGRRFGLSMFMKLLKVFYGRHAIICSKPKKNLFKKRMVPGSIVLFVGRMWKIFVIFCGVVHRLVMFGESVQEKFKNDPLVGMTFFQVVGELLGKVGKENSIYWPLRLNEYGYLEI